MKIGIGIISLLIILIACQDVGSGVFGKRTLHERYLDKLKNADLLETTLGRSWLDESKRALERPQMINIPYQIKGYFTADKPRAFGFKFSAKRGQKLLFSVDRVPTMDLLLFVDVWRSGGERKHLVSLDSTESKFDIEIDDDSSEYIIRVQPELLQNGNFTLSVSIGPSLATPVAGNKGRVASIWGDDRDGGIRRHEGIDLFAPFRTPVVASANGFVTRVNENRLGGKVVWLRPAGKQLSLYYAHLDEQLVSAGTQVQVGDTLGLIGNTGNAKSTPPHLHFGIYTRGGAVNPLPFVDQTVKSPLPVRNNIDIADVYTTTRKLEIVTTERAFELDPGTPVKVVAHSFDRVLAEIPTGDVVFLSSGSVRQSSGQRLKTISNTINLFLSPSKAEVEIALIDSTKPITVYGYYGQYAFISSNDRSGWILKTLL